MYLHSLNINEEEKETALLYVYYALKCIYVSQKTLTRKYLDRVLQFIARQYIYIYFFKDV